MPCYTHFSLEKVVKQSQSLVFSHSHLLCLFVGEVVYTTKVQDAVNDNAKEFLVVGSGKLFRIGEHGVKRDERITREKIALAGVKANVVGIVVMTDKLTVDAQNLLVVHEDIVDGVHTLAITKGHLLYPLGDGLLIEIRQVDVYCIVCNHIVCVAWFIPLVIARLS